MFGWADNVTKANILRDKQAVIAYYIYHKDSDQKTERYQGARVVCQLEEDEAVIKKLVDTTGMGHATFLRIVEILPIG